MVDNIDAGMYISIEVVAVIGLLWSFFAYRKDPEYGVKVFSWTSLLIVLFYFFPKFMGYTLTIAVCLFFIYGALRR